VHPQIWSSIRTPSSTTSLADLNPFLLVTFADLKKYRYYYWCAFPALALKPGWEVTTGWTPCEDLVVEQVRPPAHLISPARADSDSTSAAARHPDLPLSTRRRDSTAPRLRELLGSDAARRGASPLPPLPPRLQSAESHPPAQRTLAFYDPSSHSTALGWPVRNTLTYLANAPSPLDPPIRQLRIVSRRDGSALSCNVRLSGPELDDGADRPGVVGWEKNDKGKLGPRMADLAPLMDPTRCVSLTFSPSLLHLPPRLACARRGRGDRMARS